MNKMLTAVAISQLAQQGKLSFGDKVSKYPPDFPTKAIANKVNIHHLLTHTSGLGNYLRKIRHGNKSKFRNIKDYFPLIKDEKLLFEPGTRSSYSNSGFIILGAIIEKITG